MRALAADPDADSLRSVSWPAQTPYKMWKIAEGCLKPILTIDGIVEPYSMPRQILPDVYWQNGYVDIVRPFVVLELGMMCGHRVIPFVVEEPMLEIDYEEDIPRVEAALLKLKEGGRPEYGRPEKRHSV